MTKATENNAAAIRATALSFSPQKVGAMTKKIVDAFEKRDAFEKEQGLDITANNSYTRERDRMLQEKVQVSRLFLSLGVEPANVILRKVSSNALFNAKALKKVTEIACFTTGDAANKRNTSLEKVTAAFIACALIASDKGQKTVQNPLNKRFLSSAKLDMVKDESLRDSLAEMQHKTITGGRDTQSSQARNVLDVLGLGSISSIDKHRDAITIDASSDFFALFRGRYMVKGDAAAA